MTALPAVDPESTEALVARATEARDRLLKSVEALDRKRHQLVKPVVLAERNLQPALAVGAALLATGLLAAVAIRATRNSARSVLHPRHSLVKEVLWSAGVGLTAVTIFEAVKALRVRPPAGAGRASPSAIAPR
jgi:hypothetical protein